MRHAFLRSGFCFLAVLLLPYTARGQDQPMFAARAYAAAPHPADMNEDGFPDLVSTAQFGGIGVWISRGPAEFAAPVVYDPKNGANRITVADLDGDGHQDVVGAAGPEIRIHPGNGLGQLGPAVPVATGQSFAFWPAAIDFDLDGDLDLVSFSSSDVVLLANTGGTFGSPSSIDLRAGVPGDVEVADFDLDGRPDLVLTVPGGFGVLGAFVMKGTAAGSLLPPAPLGIPAERLALGDLDQDGLLDVAFREIGGNYPGLLRVAFGAAPGVLGAPSFLSPARVYSDVQIADLDEDGRDDVVASHANGGRVAFFRQRGIGDFAPPRVTLVPGGYDLQIVDLDANGHLDAILGGVVALGDGSGRFESWRHARTDQVFPSTRLDEPGALDLDQDGDLELVAVGAQEGGGPEVFWFENLGTGDTRLAGHVPSLGTAPPVSPMSLLATQLATADANGDGLEDVIIASDARINTHLSTGAGALGPAIASLTSFSKQQNLVLRDFDLDGNIDAACVSDTPDVLVFRGDGTGGFQVAATIDPDPGASLDLDAADLDLDGRPDLVATGLTDGNRLLRPLLGNGAFGFSVPPAMALPPCFPVGSAIALGEVDGDGRPDAVVVDGCDRWMLVLGDGTGGFDATALVVYDGDLRNAILADFNADGRDDLASLGAVWLNDGGGAFLPPRSSVVLPSSLSHPELLARDVNGDGRLDLVTTTVTPFPATHELGGIGLDTAYFDIAVLINHSSPGDPWSYRGHAKALTSAPPPSLDGFGSLGPLTPVALQIERAGLPSLPVFLVMGAQAAELPLLDGVLVPSPDVLFGPVPVDAGGALAFQSVWPAGVPSGLTFHFQAFADYFGTLVATNALTLTTP